MVVLSTVQASNARIATALPPQLVAVFVGATSGIGETTLKQFAKHATQPRVYFVGRSQEAGDRIKAECQASNPKGEFIFVKADTSLLRNVDEVCRDIKSKEKAINLLFISQGSFLRDETTEGLTTISSLVYYSRSRFIVNLLPLIEQATTLRRVVTMFTGTKEGPISADDFPGRSLSLLALRAHASSRNTLSLEVFSKMSPTVTFIHNFPSIVRGNLLRSGQGAVLAVIRLGYTLISPLIPFVPTVESGDRHVFFLTSAKYPAASPDSAVSSGVPLEQDDSVGRGVDGKVGSGVYSLDWNGESAGPEVERLLAKYRAEGLPDKLWQHTESEFTRITGSVAI